MPLPFAPALAFAVPLLRKYWPYIAIAMAALVALKMWGDYQRHRERQDIAKKLNVESAERLDAELERIATEHEQAAKEIADAALALEEERSHLEADKAQAAAIVTEYERIAGEARNRARRWESRAGELARDVEKIPEGDLLGEWRAALCANNPQHVGCQ